MEVVEARCWARAIVIFNTRLTAKKDKKIEAEHNHNHNHNHNHDHDHDHGSEHRFLGLDELKKLAEEACRDCSAPQRPAFALLGKALQAVDKHAPIIDVMIQQQPFVVNLVWGTIRFIIAAAARGSNARLELVRGLDQLVLAIPRYQLELRSWAEYPRVVEAIATTFAHVLCYLRHVEQLLHSSTRRRLAKAAFSTKLTRILAEHDRVDRVLSEEIRLAQAQEQAKLKQDLTALDQKAMSEFARQGGFRSDHHNHTNHLDARLSCIQREMSTLAELEMTFQRAHFLREWLQGGWKQRPPISVREPGTCMWILNSPMFTDWADFNHQSWLSIEGAAGCGKSVLAAYLRETARTDTVLLYSFQSARHQYRSPVAYFAVSLLVNLLGRDIVLRSKEFNTVIAESSPLREQHELGFYCPSDRLLQLLDRTLGLVPTYTLIVDALDECTDSQVCDSAEFATLIEFLKRLRQKPAARIIILSRVGCLGGDFFVGSHQVFMNRAVVDPDIAHYVRQKINRERELNPYLERLESRIVTKILANSAGVFLWAELAMDSLKTAHGHDLILDRLDAFPSDLVSFHLQTLRKHEQALHDDERIVRDHILLILLGTCESMNVEDIVALLSLEDDWAKRWSNPATTISRLCRPLVQVVEGQVEFVHASAELAVLQLGLTSEDADALLALKCLRKLRQDQYREWACAARLLHANLRTGYGLDVAELEETFKESVFYNYACLHWQDHVARVLEPSAELLHMLSRFLVGYEFVTWSEILFQLKSKSGMGSQIQVRTVLEEWSARLSPKDQETVAVKKFFLQAHESLGHELAQKSKDRILPYLPLVRLGQFFNTGARSTEDDEKGLEYKEAIVAGYEEILGSEHPLTLRAKMEVLKQFFFAKRLDEAERGLRHISKIQCRVVGNDSLDYLSTLQLLGVAQISVAKFDEAVLTLTETGDGFRDKSGKEAFLTLQTDMYRARALERAGRWEDSYQLYDSTLKTWVPIGGSAHPFTLMLKTGFGSVCRQLKRFPEGETVLLEAFADRERLYTIEDVTSIDSVLQLAALYYESARGEEGIEFLDLIGPLKGLEIEFERRCQEQHIRALILFSQDYYNLPVEKLRKLLDEVSGEGRDQNNRELLWVRITLADALRQAGCGDESLILFLGLVTSCHSDTDSNLKEQIPISKCTGPTLEDEPKSPTQPKLVTPHQSDTDSNVEQQHHVNECTVPTLDDEPESPAQLKLAEEALRLLKDAKFDVADKLLQDNNLKWRRKKDFWVLSGGPITDTASICGLPTALIDYQVVGMPQNLVAEIPLLRSGQD